MRKLLSLILLVVSALSGCGKQEYTLGFVPAHEEMTRMENLLPLKTKLQQLTGWHITIYVADDYADLENKIKKGVVQIAFLPPLLYVDLMDRMDMILKVKRHGRGSYRGEVLTVSDIDSLYQLRGANWAYPDKHSTSGYLLPVYTLRKMGINPEEFFGFRYEAGSHDAAVILLLRGNVQVATVFDDARELVKKEYPDVFERTKVILYTDSIPNDGIAVVKSMSERNRKKLIHAMDEIMKDETMRSIMKRITGGEGFMPATPEEYEIVKKIKEEIGG